MKPGERLRLVRWSRAVADTYGNKCPHCNDPVGSSHHIIGRVNRSTRFVLENGIYVCNTLHRLFEKDGNTHRDMVKNYVGVIRYVKLCRISRGLLTKERARYHEIE